MKVSDIVSYLESIANPSLQESYDNSGLLIGTGEEEINAVLVSLDLTEEVLDEAIKRGAKMIISHHPIIFTGLKRFNAKSYVQRIVAKAIKNDLVIYAMHTNLDNVSQGVNAALASKLNLLNTRILLPKENQLVKLVTYVPSAEKDKLLDALFLAGAGIIGNYSEASFSSEGYGTFKGNEQSKPKIGVPGKREIVKETRIEVLLNNFQRAQVLEALQRTHPYEEVAYELLNLSQANQDIGSGFIGELPEEMLFEDFMDLLKTNFNLSVIRHTSKLKNKIKKIALCGG
ncbi:MAG: Nif3-like dinuclear metal center hexameric protein, partial [Bacteroidetes bacterium]|nr:Nif3-like dinuclear metal center hexameric protein [Bacteroidota bacterium]